MSILFPLSSVAVQGLVEGACDTLGVRAVDQVASFLVERFSDHSQRLPQALRAAQDRSWRALEVALAGESWWERCKLSLATAEEKSFREQVQGFLSGAAVPGWEGFGPDVRRQCLGELQAARQAKVLSEGSLDVRRLAERAGKLAAFTDPHKILALQWEAVRLVGAELHERGYPALGKLLQTRHGDGPPLLVLAVRYFFRRQVESDPELFQGLAFAKLEQLQQSQEEAFASLGAALDRHGERLQALLADVSAAVAETRDNVLDIKQEMQRQGRQLREMGQAILQLLQQRQLERRALNPADSLSVRGEAERQQVTALVERYRTLPAEQRRQAPALLNGLAKLQVVAGDFDAARAGFEEAAALAADPAARAEAFANAHQAALEEHAWDQALAALRQAAALDPERYGPFPLAKFEPEKILGAGGFGVVYLCRNRHSGSRVVVKSLRVDRLDRALADVFREAQVLEGLEHPAIIRLRDCDFADRGQTRPYLVMDYFDGGTLADFVRDHGPLPADDFLPLAKQVAEGLHAAHARGVLHRDVKPANLLVRREPRGWQVRLIDFGLALTGAALQSTARSRHDRTLIGDSIAGTLDYAAPEQMGRLPGVPVKAYSDVYSFGKTCCYALFGTHQPTWQHWQELPRPLAELLGRCLHEDPKQRPSGFAEVLNQLADVQDQLSVIDAEVVDDRPVPTLAPAAAAATVLPVVTAAPTASRTMRRRMEADEPDERTSPRRRRGGFPWRTLLVVFVLLPCLLVFGGPLLVALGLRGANGTTGTPTIQMNTVTTRNPFPSFNDNWPPRPTIPTPKFPTGPSGISGRFGPSGGFR